MFSEIQSDIILGKFEVCAFPVNVLFSKKLATVSEHEPEAGAARCRWARGLRSSGTH